MRKLTHPALLCAIVIIGLLIPPVMAVDAAPGEMIYRPFVNGQERPDIDGDMIVWEDDRNGNKDIYFGTVDEFRDKPPLPTIRIGEGITSDDASQEKPSISGDYIVWQDNRHGNWDIYLYDRSTETTTQLTNDTGNQWMPAVSGNYAAWYDNSSSKTNIVLYDIAADSVKDVIECDAKTTIPGGTTEFKPALSENYVAWMEKADWKVHYYDIGAGTTEGLVSTSEAVQCWPSLSGSLIAWEDERHGNPDIYMTDLDNPSGGEKRVTFDGADQVSAANSETIIAWEETRVPPRSIYMYDLSPPGKELLVIDADDSGDEHLYPAVSGNTIVWQNRRGPSANLYIFIYKPAEPVDPVATTIEVNPSTFTLDINTTKQFTATAFDQFEEEMAGIAFNWSCDNETVGTIDETGLFTAVAEGTATVTATVGEITGEATVTVNANADEPVASVVTRIELDPSTFTLDINATKQFTATAFDQFEEEMAGIAFNWSCDNETVGTIDDSTGLFTAKSAGTATVTATAGDKSGESTVTVTADEPEEPALERIEVKPPTPTLEIDGSQQFTATALDQNGLEMTGIVFNWSCDNATVGEIDDTGLFTAKAAGTTDITATADNVTESATVTVNAEDPAVPELAKIVIFPSAVTLYPGDSLQFEAVGLNCYGNSVPDAAIAWTSSNETVGTIDEGGLFVAICAGTATLTASGDGATGTTTVTVSCDEPVLSSIVITPSVITLAAGETATFTATALDQDGCEMSEIVIDWDCVDPCVGTIDLCSGVFSTEDYGTTTVTATAGGITGTADVEVTGCSGVGISPSAIVLDRGDEWPFTVYGLQDNAGSTVDWSCSDPGVGDITADGCFTAICEGTASVTAMIDGVDEVGPAMVTVRSVCPVPARIVVSPSDFTIASANSLQLTETVYDQYGCEMPDAVVVWESSDPNIGAVGGCGLFAAGEEGEVTITASMDGVSGSACVTVGPRLPFPARVEVDPPDATLAPGETRVFTATVFDPSDNEMDWVKIKWSCLDDDVGTIDRSGLFSGVSQGSTEITARAGSVERTASVTVTAAPTIDPTPEPTPEPTPVPTQTPTNPGSNSRAYSDGGGDPGPTFFAGICEGLKSGETHTFSGIGVTSIGSITITASDNIPKMMLTVKETGRPNPAEPPGNTYEYVEIAVSWANPNQIGGATLTFTVPAKWLEEHGIAPEDVRLMRYVDGGWQILETEVVGEENGNYLFRATTPGFSTFAIAASPSSLAASAEEIDVTPEVTGTPEVTEEVTTEPTGTVPTTTPAAPLVYAPFLAPLAFLLWRRKKN